MLAKRILKQERIRQITGSFAFIEHRFLQDGFWSSLGRNELLLYFFLILASDRNGISFYGYDKICTMLGLHLDEYVLARDTLIDKDLLAFGGTFFQVLSLPDEPVLISRLLANKEDMIRHDPATVAQIINKSLGADNDYST